MTDDHIVKAEDLCVILKKLTEDENYHLQIHHAAIHLSAYAYNRDDLSFEKAFKAFEKYLKPRWNNFLLFASKPPENITETDKKSLRASSNEPELHMAVAHLTNYYVDDSTDSLENILIKFSNYVKPNWSELRTLFIDFLDANMRREEYRKEAMQKAVLEGNSL